MRKVNNLVINRQLLAVVADDEDADAARAATERLLETAPKVSLVDDAKTLLDLTSLRHGDELAIVTEVDQAVLLEHGAEERVEDHGRGRMGNNARLLVQLLGEQINTEITVLASLRRGGDADNLARAVLEDNKVTNADVVAGNCEGTSLARMYRRDMGRGVAVMVVVADGAVNGLGDVQLLPGGAVTTGSGVVAVVVGVRIVLAHLVGVGRYGRDGRRGRLDTVRFLNDGGLRDYRDGFDGGDGKLTARLVFVKVRA